jgi:hypothetical protein
MKVDTANPHWLFASGTADRLEVLRSPGLRDTDAGYEPVQRFIRDHGLQLWARETFAHPHFMYGEADASVCVPPATRNAGGVELLPRLEAGFAGTRPELLSRSALERVNDLWPFPDEGQETP